MLFATTIAFFIFSGLFYSQGAYNMSPGSFNLMGTVSHVWGDVLPWYVLEVFQNWFGFLGNIIPGWNINPKWKTIPKQNIILK